MDSDCSTWQKLILLPGCRPWDSTTYGAGSAGGVSDATILSTYDMNLTPFDPNAQNNEFSDITQAPQTIYSKAQVAVSRLFSSIGNSAAPQQNTRPWWDLTGKAADAAASVGSGIQSTLIKVIILVTIVGIFALFAMTYVQAKGAQFAK